MNPVAGASSNALILASVQGLKQCSAWSAQALSGPILARKLLYVETEDTDERQVQIIEQLPTISSGVWAQGELAHTGATIHLIGLDQLEATQPHPDLPLQPGNYLATIIRTNTAYELHFRPIKTCTRRASVTYFSDFPITSKRATNGVVKLTWTAEKLIIHVVGGERVDLQVALMTANGEPVDETVATAMFTEDAGMRYEVWLMGARSAATTAIVSQ